jgi:hypothetical protein
MNGLISILSLVSFVSINDCAPYSVFRINRLYLQPQFLKGDDLFVVNLRYTVPDGILVKNGTVTYSPKYNFVPFDPVSKLLCTVADCPIRPGTYTNISMNAWPWGIREEFSTEIIWRDDNRSVLLCLSIKAKVI